MKYCQRLANSGFRTNSGGSIPARADSDVLFFKLCALDNAKFSGKS
jgi:hypothetical protein